MLSFSICQTLQPKSHLCVPFLGIVRPQSQFPHSCVCEQSIYSQDRSSYLAAAKKTARSWKYINLSQIYQCRYWETELYNFVLKIRRLHQCIVSFLGLHKWESDSYIGFSPAIHLQWITTTSLLPLYSIKYAVVYHRVISTISSENENAPFGLTL